MGKWEAVQGTFNKVWRVREAEESEAGQRVVARDVRDEETARQIAALPELLAALERIAKGGWHTVTPASSVAREAIAKAKGGAR